MPIFKKLFQPFKKMIYFGCAGSSPGFVWAFSSSGKLGLLFIAVCELLIAVASPVEEQRLYTEASVLWHTGLVFAAHGL